MRRPSLSTKLFAAALPLVVAVGALLAVTVRSDLNDVQRAEAGVELGAVWNPLITSLLAVETEVAGSGIIDAGAASPAGTNAANRRATDQAINDLRTSIESLGAADAAGAHITASRSALSAARRNLDMAIVAPEMQVEVDPIDAYDIAGREIVAVGQLLPSEAGDPELGRELLAVVKLAEAKLAADTVISKSQQWPNAAGDRTPLEQARAAVAELQAVLGEFEAIAPDEWATQYRQSGFTTAVSGYRSELDQVGRAAASGQIETFDTTGFATLVDQGVQFQTAISQSIVDRATTEVDQTRRAVLMRIGIILAAVLVAALIAWAITRSIIRRIKAVANGANQVASEQLPALVEALRDPRGKSVLPTIEPIQAKGGDELSELAEAFNSMQGTLVDVAHEQVEVLRRGVSDIFVTMARRNRSLIDRQLAMLDEYEAEVDDPDVLANYYQLDHLATRMRRNSESLLVLANAEPKRRRVKATEIDDVVRASIGEVEDYRRIEIEALESLQVRGNVVADVSHLLAELLDNATSFSPPDSPVRVGGRRTGDSYMLRIVDDGVGIPTERLRHLNELLREPPIVGLSASSTLGMSVVSLLANKHDIQVTLSAGNPGLTVDVVLPSALFGPIDEPFGMTTPAATKPTTAPDDPSAQLVDWNDDDHEPSFGINGSTPETFQPAEAVDEYTAPAPEAPAEPPTPVPSAEPAPRAPMFVEDEPEQRVVPSDWTKMSLDLTAFKSGQQSAAPDAEANADRTAVATRHDATLPVTPADITAEVTPTDTTPEVRGDDIPAEVGNGDATTEAATTDDTTAPVIDVATDPRRLGIDQLAERLAGQFADDQNPVAPADTSDPLTTIDRRPPTAEFDLGGPAPRQGEPASLTDHLPPPGATVARTHGEFDVPPAPPMTTESLSRGPVTPDTARPAPEPRPAERPLGSTLPTRSPGNGPATGADEPDRLAGTAAEHDEPSALSAALAAFDSPYAATATDGHLPTRTWVGDPVEHIEDPASITQSRLDPEALRERLRAFQSEFSTGVDSDTSQHQTYDNQNSDLGGDRR